MTECPWNSSGARQAACVTSSSTHTPLLPQVTTHSPQSKCSSVNTHSLTHTPNKCLAVPTPLQQLAVSLAWCLCSQSNWTGRSCGGHRRDGGTPVNGGLRVVAVVVGGEKTSLNSCQIDKSLRCEGREGRKEGASEGVLVQKKAGGKRLLSQPREERMTQSPWEKQIHSSLLPPSIHDRSSPCSPHTHQLLILWEKKKVCALG